MVNFLVLALNDIWNQAKFSIKNVSHAQIGCAHNYSIDSNEFLRQFRRKSIETLKEILLQSFSNPTNKDWNDKQQKKQRKSVHCMHNSSGNDVNLAACYASFRKSMMRTFPQCQCVSRSPFHYLHFMMWLWNVLQVGYVTQKLLKTKI